MSTPTATDPRVTNVREASERLGDVPFTLWAAKEGVRLFWSIVCKRWPELR